MAPPRTQLTPDPTIQNLSRIDHIVVLMLENRSFDHKDPGHRGADVKEQLANGNAGFVSNYAKHNPKDPNPGTVMGHYSGTDLPIYDHLAREYAVCDHWFCSVPGATWPNRLYAVCGKAAGSKDNKSHSATSTAGPPSAARASSRTPPKGVSRRSAGSTRTSSTSTSGRADRTTTIRLPT